MKNKQNKSLQALTESALMISLAVVLSFLKLISMPYGGSVTLASLLPIAIISYRHGIGRGVFSATVYAVIQQILDLSLLSYATSWQSVVAIIVLDYLLAFAVAGIAGIFRRPIQNQTAALTLGCFLVSLCRYACHVISGATVWAGLSIPTEAALSFSFAYNATYMIPEAIILLVTTIYIASNINFKTHYPTRLQSRFVSAKHTWISPTAGLIALIAVIADTVIVFQNIQDENGNFVIESLLHANWTLVIAITATALLIVCALLAIGKVTSEQSER